MTTPVVNSNDLFKVLPSGQQNNGSRLEDPLGQFSQMLQIALDREQGRPAGLNVETGFSDTDLANFFGEGLEGEISDLSLRAGTAEFDKLGVLILRGLSEISEALIFEQAAPEQGQDVFRPSNIVATDFYSGEVEDTILQDVELGDKNERPNLATLKDQQSLAQLTIHSYHRSDKKMVLTVSPKFDVLKSSPKNLQSMTPSSIFNLTRSRDAISQKEVVQLAKEVQVNDISETQNTDIEVTVIRGELGLIVQIISPALDSRLSKALENRLRRLIEQTGEKIESFKFVSPKNANTFNSIVRASNGSN